MTAAFTTNYVRAEAGLRIRQSLVPGRSAATRQQVLPGPIVFDTLFAASAGASATGITAAIRGQLWRLIQRGRSGDSVERHGGFYRPRYQTRSELFVQDELCFDRFPSGDFGYAVLGSARVSIRCVFPTRRYAVASSPVPGYRTISDAPRNPDPQRHCLVAVPESPGERTSRCRASLCRGRRTSTACAGSSAIDKCRCRSVT